MDSVASTDENPFQFTPLREGRLIHRMDKSRNEGYFNSRPSARGDKDSARVTGSALVFQFTPLREGRPALARRQRISETYFNSRPSARGD